MGPWQRRWRGDTADRSSKESPTCTATWLYTETSKVTEKKKQASKGQGRILIGFATSEHAHLRQTLTLCQRQIFTVHTAVSVAMNTTDPLILYHLTFPHLVSHHLQKELGGGKKVLFWTPLWDKLGFVAGEIGRAKNVQHRMERL